MARYDLSKIMKKAWALFTNACAKYPTFADALRKSWKTAKWEKSIAEKCKAIEEEEKVHEEKARKESKPLLVRFFFVHKSKPTGSEEKRKPKRNA